MSQRSSFVTEYVYCDKCFAALKEVLLDNQKYLTSLAVPSWEGEGKELPIIAGKVGGLGRGDEYLLIKQLLEDADVCHEVLVALLLETEGTILLSRKPGEDTQIVGSVDAPRSIR